MERLKDPKNDRTLKDLAPPPSKPLNPELIWHVKSNPSKLTRFSQLATSQGSP